ncbi:hypothetical protein KIW84_010326 [Lathyrus oleraceus]|uniref:Neprosin PEP catalytic domain-containing protein n=1 Tax=Pisum sativum TaxID=3888 RepID=A0A9D4YN05_PEA|nr:hypothetical protein KIW84_010326 [Pisum sativum]
MINILLLITCLVTISTGHKNNDMPVGLKEEDLELERQLSILNKSPIKSIHDNVGNWWLKVVDKDIGYFPAALFSRLSTRADEVGWGGYTVTPAGTTSPAMGSGYKPDNDATHASYFKFVKYLLIIGTEVDPLPLMVDTYNDAPNCYGVTNYQKTKKDFGYSLQFGGPGGNCRT